MAAGRKLQAEVDKVLKKIDEGIEEFDNIWNNVHSASQPNQREKFETELKTQIKKLQRDREQIKTWLNDKSIKDKNPLSEARKRIELEMERFKDFERDAKTKTYSKEGLSKHDKMDPHEEERNKHRTWIQDNIDKLQVHIDEIDADIEAQSSKKSKKGKDDDSEQKAHMKFVQESHRWHITKLEQMLRKLDNDEVAMDELEELRDSVEYYVDENSLEKDMFQTFDTIYEAFALEDVEDYMAKEPEKDKKKEKEEPEEPKEEPKAEEKKADKKSKDDEPVPPAKSKKEEAKKAGATTPTAKGKKGEANKEADGEAEAKPEKKKDSAPQKPWPPMMSVWQSLPPAMPPPADKAPPQASPGPPPKPGPPSGSVPPMPPPSQEQAGALGLPPAPERPPVPERPPPPGQAPVLNAPPGQPPPKPAPHPGQQPPQMAPPTQAPPQPPLPAPPAGSPPQARGGPGNVPMPAPPPMPPPAPQDSTASASAASPVPVPPPPPSGAQGAPAPSEPPSTAPPPPPPPLLPPPPPSTASATGGPPTSSPSLPAAEPAKSKPPPPGVEREPPQWPPPAPRAGDDHTVPKVPPPNEAPPPPMESPPPPPPGGPGTQPAAEAAAPASASGTPTASASPPEMMGRPSPSGAARPSWLAPAAGAGSSLGSADATDLLAASCRNLPASSDRERDRKYMPRNPYVHADTSGQAAYPIFPTKGYEDPAMFEKYDLDTLFFIFYYQQGTYQQFLAAKELKKLSWRYNTKYFSWFLRHQDPVVVESDYERGSYVYFDVEKEWCQRIKHNFTFEYEFLEDEPIHPGAGSME